VKSANKVPYLIVKAIIYIVIILFVTIIVFASFENLIFPLFHITDFGNPGWKGEIEKGILSLITFGILISLKTREDKIIAFLVNNKVIRIIFPEAFYSASLANTTKSSFYIILLSAIQFFVLTIINWVCEWLININSHLLVPLAIMFWVLIFVLFIRPLFGLYIYFIVRFQRNR